MNWEALGAIGEIIGALAVVFTLIYLAAQVRHNTHQMENHVKAVELAAFNAIDDSFSRFRAMLASDGEVAGLWKQAQTDFDSLEGNDKERADALMHEWLIMYQNMYYRYGSIMGPEFGEVLDDTQINRVLTREFGKTGIRQWYELNRNRLFPFFCEKVDEVMRENV